jgi:hypothetical protein
MLLSGENQYIIKYEFYLAKAKYMFSTSFDVSTLRIKQKRSIYPLKTGLNASFSIL